MVEQGPPDRERILLRLSEDHPVVRRYSEGRDALSPIAQAMNPNARGGEPTNTDGAITAFEASRSAFLAAARDALATAQREPENTRERLERRER